jgi:hypothetical protein
VIERIRGAGFRWIRADITWSDRERKRGGYEFAGQDLLLDALDANRMRAMMVLAYGNDLYQKDSPSTDEARAAFVRFAMTAIMRYRDRGVLWEMWNEPNNNWSPRQSAKAYSALSNALGRAIRQSAPEEWFVGPALCGTDWDDVKFLTDCFKQGVLQYWDAVTVHPYGHKDPESAAGSLRWIRRQIERYAPAGRKIPIIVGEWGFPTCAGDVTPDVQAAYAARMALVGLMNEVGLTVWYEWVDGGSDPKNRENHFGVLLPTGAPKPAYYALRTLAEALDGFRFVKRLDLGSPDDYCLLFSGGSGERMAAWTRSKPHRVAIAQAAGAFDVMEDAGNSFRAEAGSSGLVLELTAHPVYLIPAAGR